VISLRSGGPPGIKTNIQVPAIPAGRQTLYFFPDRVLVFEGSSVGVIEYNELRLEPTNVRFIELGRLPPDAEVVDHTWKYVNKKGGPDRRFKDNRQLPVALYGEMWMRSTSGLNNALQTSNKEAPQHFAEGIASLARFLVESNGRSA
jgi:hypothetical protein